MNKKWFVTIEGLLYLSFILLDVRKLPGSSLVKYCSICLCFLYVLSQLMDKKLDKKDVGIVAGAFGFTICSDAILLFGKSFALGIMSFCVVQVLYWERLHDYKLIKLWLVVPFALLIQVVFLKLGIPVEMDLFFASFYGTMLLWNTGKAVSRRDQPLFAVGMCLFVLCDLNVAIYNLGSYVQGNGEWIHFLEPAASILMWVFYLPSQVCIACSLKTKEMS